MNANLVFVLVVLAGMLLTVVFADVSEIFLQHRYCREANFDCDSCRFWSCPAHRCRHELKKRGKCVWGEEEKRCDVCADRNCCTAANSGVLFPCPYFKLVTQEVQE